MVVFKPASGLDANAHFKAGVLPGLERTQLSESFTTSYTLPLGRQFSQDLQIFCEKHSISEKMLFLGVHIFMLSRIFNSRLCQSYVSSETSSEESPWVLCEAEWQENYSWKKVSQQLALKQLEMRAVESQALVDDLNPEHTRIFFSWLDSQVEHILSRQHPNIPAYILGITKNENEFCLKLVTQVGYMHEQQLSYYADTFHYLIRQALSNTEEPVRQDDFHKPEFKQWLTKGFNRKKYPLDTMKSLPEIVCWNMNSEGDKVAFEYGEECISFKKVAESVARLAGGLKAQGIDSGDKVAVYCERGIEWAMIQLACFSIGAVYVPIDMGYPIERIQHMIQLADVKLVTTIDNVGKDVIGSFCANEAVPVADYSSLVISAPECWESLCSQFDINNVAYIQFTSGTTGLPKGAMVEHLGMMNHLAAKVVDLNMSSQDVIAQTASQCFDVSIWQLLVGFYLGAKTVIYKEDNIWDLMGYLELTQKSDITILEVVPSYLELLFDVMEHSDVPYFHKLRYLMVTGERVTVGQMIRWFQGYPDTPVINAYGPTEASDDITHFEITKEFSGERIPIGFPIHNSNIYILDESLSLLPLGSIGEICVSGPCVGRGYINSPEATAKAFTTDPFVDDSIRLYRTGDFGRWLQDGSIEYFGRRDEQVKIMGIRIELTEVEQQLSTFSWIKDVAVVFKEEKLLCYYTSHDRTVRKSREIRAELEKVLPTHSVPSKFTRVDKMPLNKNGKIDKTRLS